ncbi:hypothetical protein ACFPT7_10125 [Acidicapsa dinghuensis]|uniref:Uncharacterized protein n=1 Tax=Acidicapsa dinghuensis TaxID=2218256 RepID=A0ABW1EEF0_9BACT|nr:hypothetical protein [Acidicapsa dinghuensis]
MKIHIVHIGFPLDHPIIPVDDRSIIAKRLSDLQQRMRDLGYSYEIHHASPETGLDAFAHRLRSRPCHGVLIGGGVAGNPAMSYFMEQIIDVAHSLAPQAKIMFYNHIDDPGVIVGRWFSSPIL